MTTVLKTKPVVLDRRRTKIIATIGPASREPAMIEQLIQRGVNLFRLNLSHGEHADHKLAYERIRAAARTQPIAILADLCGPKIRVGCFEGGKIELVKDTKVTVTTKDVLGGPGLIPSQYAALGNDVHPGDRILLDDGNLELRVESSKSGDISCTVLQGGILKDRKGMNLPGVQISEPSLTEKDRADARFALELGVDFLAMSFVRQADDVTELKRLIAGTGRSAHVIAKIEKPEALQEIDAILDAADGIMIARGDLGVEMPPEEVPVIQHELITRAREKNKPVIVATQMLESMVEHARPTRAEVSDVSLAVFRGADAVMLSAETAVGAFPLQAVDTMNRVARNVEAWEWQHGAFSHLTIPEIQAPPLPITVAMAIATAQLSRDLRVRSIVVRSRSGHTAGIVSDARPAAPILAVSVDAATCRRMNLLWGVLPVQVDEKEFENANALGKRLPVRYGLASSGQLVLLVDGFRQNEAENEPSVTVLRV